MSTTVAELIEAIDTKILAIVSGNVEDSMDYKIHGKTVTKSRFLTFLRNMRKEILESPPSSSEIEFMQFEGFDVDEFGDSV